MSFLLPMTEQRIAREAVYAFLRGNGFEAKVDDQDSGEMMAWPLHCQCPDYTRWPEVQQWIECELLRLDKRRAENEAQQDEIDWDTVDEMPF